MLQIALNESGLDPRLGLPQLLESIQAECDDSVAAAARTRRADVELETQRLRWTESQSWYVPELRSTTLALVPRGSTAQANDSSARLTSVTTEIALGLRLRPGVPALQAAQRLALTKSRLDERQSRWLREQTEDRASVQLDGLARAWLDDDGIRAASTDLEDTARRFARGERTAADLAAANRTLRAAQVRRERLLQLAIRSRIALSTNDRTDLAPPARARREELRPADLDARLLRSLAHAPLLQSARAEAARAAERARSERFLLTTAVEAGLSLPLYESSDSTLPARPEFSLSGSGSLATVVRETSVLGRWSLDLRPTVQAQRALEREARLRQAQSDLARKQYLWAELEARLELAQARKSCELSEAALQMTLDSWERERRWFEQGAATERDVRTAELARDAARVERAEAEARRQAAASALASYLQTPRGTQIDVHESPEALETWARQRFIPDNALFGFESAERRREAKLGLELASAQTKALGTPSRGTTLTTQAIQGLRGGAFSFTVALSVSLDSAHDAAQVTRAAEREGRARGHSLSLERELDEQRARQSQRFDEANALIETEVSIQQRLTAIGETLSRGQGTAPDVHPAVKQRQMAALRAAVLDSERRRLTAEEQRRGALLRMLALGGSPASARASSAPTTLEAARDALIREDPNVAIADEAAKEARGHQPIPIVSAFHPVGPFAIGSYSANRVVGPSTTKTWRGDFGLGLSLGLDESISFLASRRLADSADLEQRAARGAAALRALHELGRTWTARELARLSRAEEAEARQQLESSVEPRFALGQVTAATLLEAEQRHTSSRLRRSSDESLLRTQHALMGALGASVNDAVLDEYQSRASSYSTKLSAAAKAATSAGSDAAELAAKERAAAADSETAGSALRSVSPITALVEARPARFETTSGTEDARASSAGHELLWVFSLIIPFKPKEFGALSVASARASESDEELGAASRAAEHRRLELQQRFAALRAQQASAEARSAAAERALAELDRRLRNAQDHTTIDEVATARSALFDARRARVIVNGALLEAALLLELAKENR